MSPTGISLRLQPYVVDWTTEQLEQISQYLLDWNANSRTAFVSQALLQALVAAKGAAALMKVGPMRSQLEAFLAYSERHFQRIDKLSQASYVLEYMSTLMNVLPEEEDVESKNSASRGLAAASAVARLASASEDNGPLDIFGSGSQGAKNADSDSDSDSGSDAMARVAQASFSGIVASDSSGDDISGDEAAPFPTKQGKAAPPTSTPKKGKGTPAATPSRSVNKGSGKKGSGAPASNPPSSGKKRKARN